MVEESRGSPIPTPQEVERGDLGVKVALISLWIVDFAFIVLYFLGKPTGLPSVWYNTYMQIRNVLLMGIFVISIMNTSLTGLILVIVTKRKRR
jgi:hypothetical protein